jgi:SAM-dependent methyltransferase
MTRANASGPIESRWTREQVEAFLARERPRYQRIELPYGLVTEGQDRRTTADLILPERMDGVSFLDVGCFLGFFEHEALRRGATRAVGIDIDPDRLRQARGIADCLGLPVEFHRLDLERDPLPGRFDIVMCLNVLHHVYDPIAALDRLLAATQERLILELAGPRSALTQKLLWRRNPVRRALHALVARQPFIFVGQGDTNRAYGFHYLSPGALENVLFHHRGDVARVDVQESPVLHDRYLAVVWKRRIDHLAVVSGLPGSVDPTLCSRLIGGELPSLRAELALERAPEWTLSSPLLLPTQTDPHVRAMLFHYDIMRGSTDMKVSFERDPALDLVRRHGASTPVLFVWVDPPNLRERLEAKRRELAKKRDQREVRGALRFLEDGVRVGTLISDWLRWCGEKGLAVTFVDANAEPRVISLEELRAKAKAAGFPLDVGSS